MNDRCDLCGSVEEDGECGYCAEHYMDEPEMARACGKPVGEMKRLQLVVLGEGGWWKRISPTRWERLDGGAENPAVVPSDTTLS